MSNPYDGLPPDRFWKPAVAQETFETIVPKPQKRFRIARGAKIATAGSCFAQNVGGFLKSVPDVELLLTEEIAEDQPLFSAAYGNIYTIRQLYRLFEEATGARPPSHLFPRRQDGRFVDALRPYFFAEGFASPAEAAGARARHLAQVKRVFADADVFVFTFGLTEAWIDRDTDAVLPLAPGVYAAEGELPNAGFHNFSCDEVVSDTQAFIRGMQAINSRVRFIFTVSPVPLTATYTNEHVLVASSRSKAVLRAACERICRECDEACYFPSFDMIWNPFTGGACFAPNKRTVTDGAVSHVMNVFRQTFLADGGDIAPAKDAVAQRMKATSQKKQEGVICDEEEIERSVGF